MCSYEESPGAIMNLLSSQKPFMLIRRISCGVKQPCLNAHDSFEFVFRVSKTGTGHCTCYNDLDVNRPSADTGFSRILCIKMAQLSTAVSDLVLAVTAFNTSLLTLTSNHLFSLGMSLQGLAASAGIIKFGLSQPSSWVVKVHQALAWITTVIGLALMSSGVHFNQGSARLAQGLLLTASLFTLSVKFMAADTKTLLTKSLSGFSLLSLLFLFVINQNLLGITACVLYILSGSAVGSTGHWNGIPRVDILHYGLALGNLSFLWANV